jgi:hypothetical protein
MDPEREQQFEVAGKTYSLVFGNKALRVAEKELGKSFTQIDATSINEMTVLVWAGLQRKHPELTIADVDDLIDEVGYARLTELAGKAMSAAMPQDDGEAGDNRGNAVAAGTGANSRNRR